MPSALRLEQSSGPVRQGYLVSAEWSFDLETKWDAYLSETEASLQRAGYETVSKAGDVVVLARHVPGDSYRLRIVRRQRLVTVRFSASPD
jgi:hypothetical protein